MLIFILEYKNKFLFDVLISDNTIVRMIESRTSADLPDLSNCTFCAYFTGPLSFDCYCAGSLLA